MYKVVKVLEFCYGHRLLNYQGKCANLHGHNASIEVELVADKLDSRGLLFDFADVKRIVKSFVDENLDHKMLLNAHDPMLKILQERGEPHYVMQDNPSAENIAKLIYDHAKKAGLPVNEVRLWEAASSYACYKE